MKIAYLEKLKRNKEKAKQLKVQKTEKKVADFKAGKIINAVQLWEVRWFSRAGLYSSDAHEEVEVFTSQGDAELFAGLVQEAFAMLRFSGDKTEVTCKKRGTDEA